MEASLHSAAHPRPSSSPAWPSCAPSRPSADGSPTHGERALAVRDTLSWTARDRRCGQQALNYACSIGRAKPQRSIHTAMRSARLDRKRLHQGDMPLARNRASLDRNVISRSSIQGLRAPAQARHGTQSTQESHNSMWSNAHRRRRASNLLKLGWRSRVARSTLSCARVGLSHADKTIRERVGVGRAVRASAARRRLRASTLPGRFALRSSSEEARRRARAALTRLGQDVR